MGDMEGGSWRGGILLALFLTAFLVLAVEFGGGSDPVRHVRLACEGSSTSSLTCRELP